jgi:DNA polymerase-3 subunit alpha
LDITEVDPIQYGLLFERFLNPERVSMPDIDIDFCYERREEIIRYVRQKYGERNVSQIITFGSMNARAVIRDVGRVMKIAYGEVDQIAKMIPFQKDLEETLETVPDFKKLTDSNPVYTEMIAHAKVLEGLARHASIHAAGVVIAPGDLTDYVPLFKSTQGDVITTQFDMKSLEKAGLLKMDFLGLRTLTVIDYTLQALARIGIEIDINRIPVTDPDAFRIFANGETVGIFQFESSGMREYLKKLQPESIEDLTAMNALYRPGPMENIDDFINRKQRKVPVKYLHPLLEPILKETQGIVVYQEQVMRIVSDLAGFTLAKADILRKAIGKKNIEMLQQQKAAFFEGAKKNGIEIKTTQEIFDLIEKFAGYGFNKSHAVCYSVVAYQTAYLKAHHPQEFMAANLTSELGDTDRIVTLIGECERMGIHVLQPDVNRGEYGFIAVEGGIQFGLGAVKNVGRSAVESIVAARQKGGTFHTIFEFCERINLRLANRKVLESLIQAGAMDSLEGSRAQKMAALTKAVQLVSYQSKADAAQASIFEDDPSAIVYPALDSIDPWPSAEKLRREKEMLGFYISGHPLKKFEDDLAAFCKPLNRLSDLQAGQAVRVGGMIEEVKTTLDRKKKTMAFFTIEDLAGSVRVVVFADTFEKYKNVIQKENMVLVIGKADRRDEEETNILASEVIPLEEARTRFSQRLVMRLGGDQVKNGISDRLQFLFARFSGLCPLVFQVTNGGGSPCVLHSKKFKVNPIPELVHDLREILGAENVWIE